MLGFKPKELSPEQLAMVEQWGEQVGSFFRKKNLTSYANTYISKHRLVLLPTIIVACFGLSLYGFFVDADSVLRHNVPAPSTAIYDDSVEDLSNQYRTIMYDYRMRLDSIQTLFERGNLTYEDSLYIATSMEYIRNIKQ